ncbi:hypothetical protein SDC9_59839 [bioreactor metagenome]|uniref:Integrase catalytic domain-containing protein n=1 Tax=bioreactor metagenome TaxID=1076179 RepID=A0A644XB90_9ZZZZ
MTPRLRKLSAEARLIIFDYIETFYNNIRLQKRLGYLSLNDFENLKNNVISLLCMSKGVDRGHTRPDWHTDMSKTNPTE